MVLISKHAVKDKHFFQVRTPDRLVYLDFPAPLYGKNFTLPSFSCPPRRLSFNLYRSSTPPDALFITHSRSLGCLFFGKVFKEDVPIYCTPPIYEQIIMRYEEYAFSQVSYVDDDDPEYDVFSIDQADLKYFKRNVILVQFGEVIPCGLLSLTNKPAGTFIGWSHLCLTHQSASFSVSYVTSYATRKRISLEAKPIDGDYLILNVCDDHFVPPSGKGIELLNDVVTNSSVPVVISVEYATLFVEILLHVFSLLRSSRPIVVYAVSPVVHKLEQLVVNQGEWLNTSLSGDSESISISEYPLFRTVETFSGIEPVHRSERAIIFYNDLVVPLISERQKSISFSASSGDHVSVIDLKMDMSQNEISDFFLSPRNFSHHNASILIDFPCLLGVSHKLIHFPIDINVVASAIYTNGILRCTDKKTPGKIEVSVHEEPNAIKIALASTARLILDGEWFVVPEKRLKFRIIGDCIEYKKVP